MRHAKWALRIALGAEALCAAALAVLYRFAYFRAGMNHHAKYQRMALLRDHLQPGGKLLWTVFALAAAVLLLRMRRLPAWYRAIGTAGSAVLLALLHLPSAKTWILYYYLFYAGIVLLFVHLLAGWLYSKQNHKTRA